MAPSQFRTKRQASSVPSSRSKRSAKRPRNTPSAHAASRPGSQFHQQRRLTIAIGPTSSAAQNTLSDHPSANNSVQRLIPDFGTTNDDNDDERQDNVVMAINKSGRDTIGCAYYVAREGLLRCMEDVKNADPCLLNILKTDIRPTVLLISPGAETWTEEGSRRPNLNDYNDVDESTLPYKLEIRPITDFRYEQAVQKLAMLATLDTTPGIRFLVPGDEENDLDQDRYIEELGLTDRKGKTLHISGCLDLDNKMSIGCAGAVVTYLHRKGASGYLPGNPEAARAYRILRLEMFSFQNTMLINEDTLVALQITQPESHPNATKQGPGSSGAKESLSIYGLFYHFAKTQQGKTRLRQMFLHPSLNVEHIRQRHHAVAVFVQIDNQSALQDLTKSLGRIKNMKRIVVQLHKGIEGGNHVAGKIRSGVWSSLLDFCYHVIDISDTLKGITGVENVVFCRQVLESIPRTEFQALGKVIWDMIHLDESQNQHRTVIKRGINQELDQIKTAYDSMDELLQQTALEVVHEMPKGDQVPPINIVYFPQLGFHVTLPLNEQTLDSTYPVPGTWERTFTTANQAYYKTERMRTMDQDLGDMYATICDIEIEMSHGLAQLVLEKEELLVTASELCGELDSLAALALGAIEYRLSRPRIVDENVIDVKGGRHILQEMTVPSYVPNDAFLLGANGAHTEATTREPQQHPHMLLLTGPNYSGKSVYLKQVALICFMAQVGSFVPAEYAKIGITDKIMTRISTRETVSKDHSAFMNDLQQISWALRSFTNRSLLIIDEFGKGTDSCDGAGLTAGVLQYLLSLGHRSPKVLASTHFHEIFEQNILSEAIPGLGLLQMEVQVDCRGDHKVGEVVSEIVYLYNVRPGRNAMSYGTHCALMNGIPEVIVQRAADLTDLALKGEDLVAICASVSPEEAEELQGAEVMSRVFMATDLRGEGAEDLKVYLSSFLTTSKTSRVSTSANE